MHRYILTMALVLLSACGSDPQRGHASDGGVLFDGSSENPVLQFDGSPALVDGAPADFSVDAAIPADASVPVDGSQGTWVEVCNVTSFLNMRSGPGTEYSVITTLPPEAKALLLDGSGIWWQIEYQGQVGWCHSDYLCPISTGDGGIPPGDVGAFIGTMWNTYYYLAHENDYPGTKDTTLYDASCNPLATVSAAYSDAVCIEGSGKLSSGEVINYATTCSCGRPCSSGNIICYKKLPLSHPWGEGAYGNALVPFRSIAVDQSTISLKTVIYLKEWDGVALPSVSGIGGFVHDGCFRADDVGSAIVNNHYDFFAGTKQMYQALEGIHPTQSTFAAYHGGQRCAYLQQP